MLHEKFGDLGVTNLRSLRVICNEIVLWQRLIVNLCFDAGGLHKWMENHTFATLYLHRYIYYLTSSVDQLGLTIPIPYILDTIHHIKEKEDTRNMSTVYIPFTSPDNLEQPYDGPPRNLESIDQLKFDDKLQPKNYSIAETSPDSRMLITDVWIIDATGKVAYQGDV